MPSQQSKETPASRQHALSLAMQENHSRFPSQQYSPPLHNKIASFPPSEYVQKFGQSSLCHVLSAQVRRS